MFSKSKVIKGVIEADSELLRKGIYSQLKEIKTFTTVTPIKESTVKYFNITVSKVMIETVGGVSKELFVQLNAESKYIELLIEDDDESLMIMKDILSFYGGTLILTIDKERGYNNE